MEEILAEGGGGVPVYPPPLTGFRHLSTGLLCVIVQNGAVERGSKSFVHAMGIVHVIDVMQDIQQLLDTYHA